MCGVAWFLLAVILVFCATALWWTLEMKRETEKARGVLARADIIRERAMRELDRALQTRLMARLERDEWKFARICSEATAGKSTWKPPTQS